MLKNFRAFQLAKEFYQICKTLKLPVHLKDQLMRASSSTALNLAESSGERTDLESQAILELEGINNPTLTHITDQLGAVLYKLCRIAEKREKFGSKVESFAVVPSVSIETEY